MNILIDLQHPAHLHFFRNVGERLVEDGHRVLFTGRDKDILVELGRLHGIDIEVFGVAKKGLANLGRELVYRQSKLVGIIRRFRPDVMMAIAGTFVSSLGFGMRIPTYVFYDTEHAFASNALAYPFATCIYVPRCYLGEIRFRHERYAGYHELAYLHPRYFTADPSVLAEAGIGSDERFTLVRFVAWGAAHDIAQRGLTLEEKVAAVRKLGEHSRVVISGEGGLPPELEPQRLQLPVHRIHHLMHHAALVFGESGTMPSEASVMGVPSVYVNPLRLGYLEEQERDYGLVSCFRPESFDGAIARGVEVLDGYDREHWRRQGRQLLADKIDVTEMLFRIATERPYWDGARPSAVYWRGVSAGSEPDPPPFFVVGSGRSGTTLLHSMITSHSAIAIAPETQLMSKAVRSAEARGVVSRGRVVDPEGLKRVLAESRYTQPLVEYLEELPVTRDDALGEVLHRLFMAYARARGKLRWGEKTPHHLWYWRQLDQLFPTARFIIVVRDGRDVASSLTRSPWAADNLLLNAYRWKVEQRQARQLMAALPARSLEVRYERLVSEPGAELGQVCAFLGVEFEDRMMSEFARADVIHEHEHAWKARNREALSTKSIGRYRRDLSPDDVLQLETLLEPELRAMGYDVSGSVGGAALRTRLVAEAATRFYASFGRRYLDHKILRPRKSDSGPASC